MPMQEMISRMTERAEQQFFGKYRGIVKDNKDPLKLGRLKVSVPSLMIADVKKKDSDESVSDWAWPCLPWGGAADQGFFFVPEVGANVWMEYEEGNLDHPIWVGTYWANPSSKTQIPDEAQDMAGTKDDKEPQRRVLKTPSGHTLEFCDIKDKERINLVHKDGALINMDEKGSITVINKKGSLLYLNADGAEACLIDENGNSVSMNSDGVTVTSKDGSVVDLGKDVVQVIAKNVHIRSQTVSLGEGAMEPAILGRTFAAMFDAHMHPTTAPGAPTGPPIPLPMPLSVPTNPALSQCVKVK